jgi:hypothetical protein
MVRPDYRSCALGLSGDFRLTLRLRISIFGGLPVGLQDIGEGDYAFQPLKICAADDRQ